MCFIDSKHISLSWQSIYYVVKLFSLSLTKRPSISCGSFVPDKHFQLSLIFASNTVGYLSGALFNPPVTGPQILDKARKAFLVEIP
jgi:hypothetical protein